MKRKAVLVRLSEDRYEELTSMARAKGTKRATLLHTFMDEGMAGYDRKQESMLEQMRQITEQVEMCRRMTASVIGALALLDVKRHGPSEIQEIRKNLDESFGLANAADQLHGQFLKKPTSGV